MTTNDLSIVEPDPPRPPAPPDPPDLPSPMEMEQPTKQSFKAILMDKQLELNQNYWEARKHQTRKEIEE